jgi:hypothetical protein
MDLCTTAVMTGRRSRWPAHDRTEESWLVRQCGVVPVTASMPRRRRACSRHRQADQRNQRASKPTGELRMGRRLPVYSTCLPVELFGEECQAIDPVCAATADD